jgi:hypothetical protein
VFAPSRFWITLLVFTVAMGNISVLKQYPTNLNRLWPG